MAMKEHTVGPTPKIGLDQALDEALKEFRLTEGSFEQDAQRRAICKLLARLYPDGGPSDIRAHQFRAELERKLEQEKNPTLNEVAYVGIEVRGEKVLVDLETGRVERYNYGTREWDSTGLYVSWGKEDQAVFDEDNRLILRDLREES